MGLVAGELGRCMTDWSGQGQGLNDGGCTGPEERGTLWQGALVNPGSSSVVQGGGG